MVVLSGLINDRLRSGNVQAEIVHSLWMGMSEKCCRRFSKRGQAPRHRLQRGHQLPRRTLLFSRIVTAVAMVLSLQHAILTTGWSGSCWIGAPGQSRTAVFASNVLQEISLVARSLGITCEVPRDPQGLGPD